MPIIKPINSTLFAERRQRLKRLIEKKYHNAQSGVVLLIAGFEDHRTVFRQEASFYYFTGIDEPATMFIHDLKNDETILFIPNFGQERVRWMHQVIQANGEYEKIFGINRIEHLGLPASGYQLNVLSPDAIYKNVKQLFNEYVSQGRLIYTLNPTADDHVIEQRMLLHRMKAWIPNFSEQIHDIFPLAAQLRRKKDSYELDCTVHAVNVTVRAHKAAANSIVAGNYEFDVQAAVEEKLLNEGCAIAFPSIIASGPHSTVLHYHLNNKMLENKDLVVVDIGAWFDHYCADLSRTYPVSGMFSQRQKKLYDLVLETQEFISNTARPGLWLSNKKHPDKSLHHLAHAFLKEKGEYDKYFIHGIGHFLGLEVHDLGDYQEPLAPGDVITIEPGIYIRDEGIGIRIEDNYLIREDGALCLSDELPKAAEDIELLMHIGDEDEDDTELIVDQADDEEEHDEGYSC